MKNSAWLVLLSCAWLFVAFFSMGQPYYYTILAIFAVHYVGSYIVKALENLEDKE